jgi:hypothetical protein
VPQPPLFVPQPITQILYSRVTSSAPQPVYPEAQSDLAARFAPSTHPIGVCFSGGGPRSFAASLGQMRGLMNASGGALYDRIGAISCVSGGCWFGALFSYANPQLTDAQLLGPVTPPQAITLDGIATIDPNCLGYGLTRATNSAIVASLTCSMLAGVPTQLLYGRMLNAILLHSFGVDDVSKFFTLDAGSLAAIVAKNGVSPSSFYLMRPNRPFFIGGCTQVYPEGEQLQMRHFEYSPLYAGTPQYFPGAGANGLDIGGGYAENFPFGGAATTPPDASGYVTVDAAKYPFCLPDVIGSSGAAPGSVLDEIGFPSLFPEFDYWPPRTAGANSTAYYSFVDGGDLENTGIVPLLRRQYPVIVACVNTSTAMGSPGTVDNIDTQIASLFGMRGPTPTSQTSREIRQALLARASTAASATKSSHWIPQQPVQVFPSADWPAVAAGLNAAKASGGPVVYANQHTIVPDNPFGILPYPNGQKVTVVWLYNEIIPNWVSQLAPPVQAFLASSSPANDMANFPNYRTVLQNRLDWEPVPELLWLSPQQVNLLADMWTWAVMEAAATIHVSLP